MRIDVWSDLVCPWCYVGKRRFERALGGFPHRDVEVVHRSFQLNPAAPRGRTSDRGWSLRAKYGLSEAELLAMEARMVQVAKDEGLDFRLAGQVTGNTLDAHRLLHLARERGLQDPIVERFYRAYFTEQRSLFDPESLATLAMEAGLDEPDVRRVLDGEAYADAVARDVREAASLGVRGVPFFLIDGRHGISGAQPAEAFRKALEAAPLASSER